MTPNRFARRVAAFCALASISILGGCRGSGARVEGPDGSSPVAPTSDAGQSPTAVGAGGCTEHAATGAEPLIDGFDGNGLLPANDGRAGLWFFYDDGTAGQQVVERAGPELALHVSSQGFTTWGSGLGVTLAPGSTQSRVCPYDASVQGGLSFRARGTGRIRLRVAMPETTPVADGGECTLPGEDCYDWAGAWLALEPEWKTYELPFCGLKPEGWSGTALPLDPSRISSLHFMLEGQTDLWLDDLGFTPSVSSDAACTGPCPLESAPAESVDPERTWLALSDSLSLHTFDQDTASCGPIKRRYLSYVPAQLTASSDAPVVMALHGSGANAESFQETMARGGLDALAERDGFIVVYGNAAPGAYSQADLLNSGAWRQSTSDDGQVDDLAYLKAVLADLERRAVISGDNPLFLMGLSNGGGMVLEAARRWPERISGIAPFMAFDGFEPDAIPALGDALRRVMFGYAPGDPGLPANYSDDVLARLPAEWARALGLSSEVIASPVTEQLTDTVVEGADYTGNAPAALATRDSHVSRVDYGSASDTRRVRVLVFENAGHFWPNPVQDSEDWILERWGFRNQDVDASVEAWEFFRELL